MLKTAISPVLPRVPKWMPETSSSVSDSLNSEYCVFFQLYVFMS